MDWRTKETRASCNSAALLAGLLHREGEERLEGETDATDWIGGLSLLRWITTRFEEEVQGGKEIAASLHLATEERTN
jgi:hypothetical protein